MSKSRIAISPENPKCCFSAPAFKKILYIFLEQKDEKIPNTPYYRIWKEEKILKHPVLSIKIFVPIVSKFDNTGCFTASLFGISTSGVSQSGGSTFVGTVFVISTFGISIIFGTSTFGLTNSGFWTVINFSNYILFCVLDSSKKNLSIRITSKLTVFSI